jgi:hypothetical protein
MTTSSQHSRRRPFGGRLIVPSALAACLLAGGTVASVAWRPAAPSPRGESFADCQLDYRRADNMWAPAGQPSASLGTESVGLTAGQKRLFITDWKYEKVRNDGTQYYGSHLRIATNRSARPMSLTVRGWVGDVFNFALRTYPVSLPAYASKQFKADLVDVLCQ